MVQNNQCSAPCKPSKGTQKSLNKYLAQSLFFRGGSSKPESRFSIVIQAVFDQQRIA